MFTEVSKLSSSSIQKWNPQVKFGILFPAPTSTVWHLSTVPNTQNSHHYMLLIGLLLREIKSTWNYSTNINLPHTLEVLLHLLFYSLLFLLSQAFVCLLLLLLLLASFFSSWVVLYGEVLSSGMFWSCEFWFRLVWLPLQLATTENYISVANAKEITNTYRGADGHTANWKATNSSQFLYQDTYPSFKTILRPFVCFLWHSLRIQ